MEKNKYSTEGRLVMQDGGVAYECESKKEATAIAKCANLFLSLYMRDHLSWEELEAFMERRNVRL
jgi:hypothetical protein